MQQKLLNTWIQESCPRDNELVFKVHILLYHSTLGSRVIKKKKKRREDNV